MNIISSIPHPMPRYHVLDSFAARVLPPPPTFQGTVAQLFKAQWQEKYPSRDVSVGQLKLAEPVPFPNPDSPASDSVPPRYRYMLIVDVMIQSYIDAKPVRLIQGVHHLITDSDVEDLYLLSVDMTQVQTIINDCSALLMEAYQEALVQYWSEKSTDSISPFKCLKQALRSGMNSIVPDANQGAQLSNEQAAALAVVVNFPDKIERLQASAETPVHAYLVAIENVQNSASDFVQLPGMLLVTQKLPDRMLVLSYSDEKGIERHDSLQSFGASLSPHVLHSTTDGSFHWSLYEPRGDFFTAFALTLLDKKVREIGVTGLKAQAERWSVALLANTLDDAASIFPFFNQAEQPYYDHVMSTLPAWLRQANSRDQRAYSALMIKQAIWHAQTHGQTFLEGIVALPVFTRQLLTAGIKLQHPLSTVDVAQIDIHEVVIENIWLGQVSEKITPLAEFALTHLGGKPSQLMAVIDRQGEVLPDWLSVQYVKRLVDGLDISSRYIEQLKHYLVDNAAEAAGRLALYRAQLSIQLPLLALEKKIKGESGFTEMGWQLVQRILRPDVPLSAASSQLCVRPLGFYAYEGAAADFVSNMFVFGSRGVESGPFVLYAPFAREPLREFETWPALMAAIKQPGELQALVLAWLDDFSRGYYIDGGFERPHLEGVLLEGFLRFLPRSPALLSTLHLDGDYVEAMFDAHAEALITLADRNTVSTSERRWHLLKECAWTLFNGLTFFITGPWQRAAWIFQTLISLRSGLMALQEGDKETFTHTVIDLLFNISQALLHEHLNATAQSNDRLRLKVPVDKPIFTIFDDIPPKPAEPPQVKAQVANKLPDSDPRATRLHSTLDYSWFSPDQALTQAQRENLETFVVDIDLSQGQRIEVGALQGLINYQGKTYVQLNGIAYRVTRSIEGLVIQDARQPERLGPRLRSDPPGQWHLDVRLGLKGGGPKTRIKKLREEKLKKVEGLLQEADLIKLAVNENERVMGVAEALLENTTVRRAEIVERYAAEFEKWRKNAQEFLSLMTKIEQLMPTDGRAKLIQEQWVRLTLRHFKLQTYLEEVHQELPFIKAQVDFVNEFIASMKNLEEGSSSAYDVWINKLKKAETIEAKLFDNLTLELEALNHVKKRQLPTNSALWALVNAEDKNHFDRHWSAIYLETLYELVIRRDAFNLSPEEQRAFHHFGQATVVDTVWSHINLRTDNQLYSDQHIAFFENAIEQYSGAERICENLVLLQSEHFRNEFLAPIIRVLNNLKDFAESELGRVIQDSESSSSEVEEPRPGPSRLMNVQRDKKPASSRQPQQIIKTTDQLMLVGSRRKASEGVESDIVEVTEGIGRIKVYSYKQIESGEWQEIGSHRPSAPQTTQARNLAKLVTDARTQLDRVDNAIENCRSSAATAKIPVEIEDILEFKARSLDSVSAQIDQVLIDSSAETEVLTPAREQTARALSVDLKLAAVRLRTTGKGLRVSIIKRLPPTGPNVEYLKAQGEVRISRLGGRKFLSKGQRKDYLQEYLISDKDGTQLWFAHFHYKTLETPALEYEAGHLKTLEQRTLSEQALYARANSGAQFIEIYRAKLDSGLAQRLFLSLP